MNKIFHILVVDDSPNLRQIIKNFLKTDPRYGEQLIFHEGGNGEEAEQVLQEQNILGEPIDLIFLDWMMPKFSGFDFLKKIRNVELFKKDPPVIMLTAETYSENINACLKFGVTTYLTKPFTQNEVCAALERCLGKARVNHVI